MAWFARSTVDDRRGRARRVAGCFLALLALVAGLTPAIAAAEPPTGAAELNAKIEPELRQELGSERPADFWVRFAARADLSGAHGIRDWAERGVWVAETLRRTAAESQAAARARLDAEGVAYQAFWATNAIHVRQGSASLAAELAGRPEVLQLRQAIEYRLPEPSKGEDVPAVAGVEWGVANINADDVWAQYGARGDGLTIASIDTGVQFDHPALAGQYRGNRGDGAFDHAYNWFDAAGTCPVAPCDTNGHGTHTMGTMAGSDGGENRIGVAPGATWIAANGCCPSDTALVASGQWLLAPGDLSGNNTDASKRPHIINNSWGTLVPSNDPFMEDISAAWAASGIFAVWANGNNAPGCGTSGSPGSRIINYSAGAYDVNNAIASFSSRGAGQDGELKPNLSAPGVSVRSAVPGNGYATNSGTSMAAPHVAGAVALLWSAAPALVGDINGTRRLLDGSAVDAPNGECGGTDDDNNVFGEGRLDALALIDSAPVAETGTLRVTVTSAGKPLVGATVAIDGPVARERLTGADGTVSVPLPAGDYTVTASAFGQENRTVRATVRPGSVTRRDLALRALPRVEVSGRVTDGSGHGWPLYAKITVAGVPGGTFYTRPADGRYSFSLPAGTYSYTVEARSGGYQQVSGTITVGRREVTRDVAVPVEPVDCTAPGYAIRYDGAGSTFDSGLPPGWTVADNLGNGQVWRFDDPRRRGNRTGGAGTFAIVDSLFHGPAGHQDTALVTPVADLSGLDAPVIGFRQDYDRHADTATVELSVDGGTTWETVLTQTADARGPRTEVLPIPQAAKASRVQVRFRYVGNFDDWWQLDEVYVGARVCAPTPGGLVLGHVHDRNTGAVLNGATVTAGPASATSATTPEDPALADGFYSMFVPGTGSTPLAASAPGYSTLTETVAGLAGGVTRRDLRLAAGRLWVRAEDVSARVSVGRSATRTFTVTNTGSAPATVEFSERGEASPIPRAGESTVDQSGVGGEIVLTPGDFSPLAFTPSAAPGEASSRRTPVAAHWLGLADHPGRIMDNAVGELDGRIYSAGGVDGTTITAASHVYDPTTRSWSRIADLPSGRESAAGAIIGGTFYVTGGWGPDGRVVRTTFAYDLAANAWRSVADAPVFQAASGRSVLNGQLYVVGGCTNACDGTELRRYDPATDSWERLADFPHPAGHLACGAIKGKLYCAGGIRRGGTVWRDTYAYDPAANTWTPRSPLPIPLWGMGYSTSYDQLLVSGGNTGGAITNESFSYDPETDTWTRLPAASNVTYRGGSACGLTRIGGSVSSGFNPVAATELLPTYGACAPVDLPWLSLGTGTVTLAPGERITVTVRLTGTTPGVLRGGVWIKEDTPYLAYPVDARLNVRAPKGL